MGTPRHAPAAPTDRTALRRGWTTGACATAAVRSAAHRLLHGEFLDPVTITLPKGHTPAFSLAHEEYDAERGIARCGIVKDAGDDPDATHGALIIATVSRSSKPGVEFRAGEGVGMVTREGLPIGVGEPAINPVPRAMIENELRGLLDRSLELSGWIVEIGIPGGENIAADTWNPRLGIVGGLSILGTTGIVNPYSCAAWIHSIHRGIDVARAAGCDRVIASTGSTSEATAASAYPAVPLHAFIDMGDFAGGMLKYLRDHPVPNLTISGGLGKLTKLAQGSLDLHSSRSSVDTSWLAEQLPDRERREMVASTRSASEALLAAGPAADVLASAVARRARENAVATLRDAPVAVEVIVIDRTGAILARSR